MQDLVAFCVHYYLFCAYLLCTRCVSFRLWIFSYLVCTYAAARAHSLSCASNVCARTGPGTYHLCCVHAKVHELVLGLFWRCAGARTGGEKAQDRQNRDSAPAPNAVQRTRTPAVALAASERVTQHKRLLFAGTFKSTVSLKTFVVPLPFVRRYRRTQKRPSIP